MYSVNFLVFSWAHNVYTIGALVLLNIFQSFLYTGNI